MKFINRIFVAGAILLYTLPSSAADDGICTMAKTHLIEGGPRYAAIFDQMLTLIKRAGIHYIEYERTDTRQNSCGHIYGGCGANLFTVDTSLSESGGNGHINVVITPQSEASNSGDYYVFGKLDGPIAHNECGLDTEYVNGHSWAAAISSGEIQQKMRSPIYVGTSLSKAGHTVANGYKQDIAAYVSGYGQKTIIVKMQDFAGNVPTFGQFTSLLEELQVYR